MKKVFLNFFLISLLFFTEVAYSQEKKESSEEQKKEESQEESNTEKKEENNNPRSQVIPNAESVVAVGNPQGYKPVTDENILWKRVIWRRMDLKEKQNQSFFSVNSEITRYLIEGVKEGLITPYKNDSLKTKLSLDDFSKNMTMDGAGPQLSDDEKKAGFSEDASTDDGWGAATTTKTEDTPTPAPVKKSYNYELFPTDISIIEIKEDAIFDKQRSRLVFDVKSITIVLPSEKTTKGFDIPIASFNYRELDKYFRSNPKKFIWYNSKNDAQHKCVADALDLRLFQARVIKMSNPKDLYLNDVYGSEKEGLKQSLLLEQKLLEKEYELWEY